jgi:hypothetical protein
VRQLGRLGADFAEGRAGFKDEGEDEVVHQAGGVEHEFLFVFEADELGEVGAAVPPPMAGDGVGDAGGFGLGEVAGVCPEGVAVDDEGGAGGGFEGEAGKVLGGAVDVAQPGEAQVFGGGGRAAQAG